MKKRFFIILALIALLPLLTIASSDYSNSYDINVVVEDAADFQIDLDYNGLVPCGRCLHSGGDQYSPHLDNIHSCDTDETFIPCTLCHLFIVFDSVIGFFFTLISILAILAIVVSGLILITSSGKADRISRAKDALTATIIGLFLALLAWNVTAMVINQFMDTDEYDIDWTSGGIQVQHMCELTIDEDDFE